MARAVMKHSSRDALRIMNSRAVQRELKRRGEAGVRAFRAAAPKGPTGDFRRNVRLETATGKHGRKGFRLVAFATRANAPVPIEFGSRNNRPALAMQRAAAAMEGRRR